MWRKGQDAVFQTGELDQRVDEKAQLFALLADGFHIGAHLRGQLFLRQQLAVQHQVGDGRFGLVGDVGNHLLNLVLFDRHILCGEGTGGEVIGKLGFQRRKAAFIKVAFGVASFQCGIEHLFDGVHRFFGAAAVDEDNQQSKQNHTDRQQKQELIVHSFSSSSSRCRRRFG